MPDTKAQTNTISRERAHPRLQQPLAYSARCFCSFAAVPTAPNESWACAAAAALGETPAVAEVAIHRDSKNSNVTSELG